MTVTRALRLLVGILLVAILFEQGAVTPSPTIVAQQDPSDPDALEEDGLSQVVATVTPQVLLPLDPDDPRAAPAGVSGPGRPPATVVRCDDPDQVLAPIVVELTATAIPLYQPIPYRTGEFVVVAETNGHGAPFRVAPRALARVVRVVPEGEELEVVGADIEVDRVRWAYVRDGAGNIGWVVSHFLTTSRYGPRIIPAPARPEGVTCPTSTAIATFGPGIVIRIISDATPTPSELAP